MLTKILEALREAEGPLGLAELASQLEIDMKPTELMNCFGKVFLHWLHVASIHIRQAKLDVLFKPSFGKVLDDLSDGLLASFFTALKVQDQATQGVDDHHTQYLVGLQDFAWPIIDPKGFCAGFDGKRSLFKAKTLFARP